MEKRLAGLVDYKLIFMHVLLTVQEMQKYFCIFLLSSDDMKFSQNAYHK